MAINRIEKLRHPGVLREFAWPKGLPDFGRYNLIYGWNGTGKTTISRVFRDLELGRTPGAGDVVLNVDGRNINGEEFPPETQEVRVFNQGFIDDNVFHRTGADVPSILVVGRTSIADQRELDDLRQRLAELSTRHQEAVGERDNAERAHTKHCSDRAKTIKDHLLSEDTHPFRFFDARDYKQKIEEVLATGGPAAHRLSEQEVESAHAVHQARPMEQLAEVKIDFVDLPGAIEDVNARRIKTVESHIIESLRDDDEVSTWVERGLTIHDDRRAEACLFCTQRIPAGRIEAIKDHFNQEYVAFHRQLDEQIDSFTTAQRDAAAVRPYDPGKFHASVARKWDDATTTFRLAVESQGVLVESLVVALKEKKARPFEQLSPIASVPGVVPDAVKGMNDAIDEHNEMCADLDVRQANAREGLVNHYVAETAESARELESKIASAESERAESQQEMSRLRRRIEELEGKMLVNRLPAEELNEDLRRYLGHGEIQLEIKETGYQINRGDVRAVLLSEGERTAVALLYFLRTLTDERFDATRGVVVLDDPVSSLDAQALYLAFAFIKERTKKVSQLFIFTHNWSLFRLVRRWFSELNQWEEKDQESEAARFYMLECDVEQDPRTSTLKPLDPLLRDHESEYQYLFSRVWDAAHRDGEAGLSAYYVLPNVARRLMEAFLGFRYPDSRTGLADLFQRVELDPVAKTEMQRFMNVQSHIPTIGDLDEDPSVLATTRVVLRNVLNLMEAEDANHYRGMVKTARRAADA